MKLPNLAMDSGDALLQVMAWTVIRISTSRDSHRGRKVARKAAICRIERHQSQASMHVSTQWPTSALLAHGELLLLHLK